MKLIKITYDHFIIVDDSEIKEGDWCMYNTGEIIHYLVKLNTDNLKKITHSTKPLEVPYYDEENYRISFDKVKELHLSEIKELIGEVDVEKKAENEYPYVLGYYVHDENRRIGEQQDAYKLGYHQALEDNKEKKYTEEDMIEFDKWKSNLISTKKEDYPLYMLPTDSTKWLTTKELLQIWKEQKPKTEWEVEFDESGKLKLK